MAKREQQPEDVFKAFEVEFANMKAMFASATTPELSQMLKTQFEGLTDALFRLVQEHPVVAALPLEAREHQQQVQAELMLFNLGMLLMLSNIPTPFTSKEQSDSIMNLNKEVVEECQRQGFFAWFRPFPTTYATVFLRKFFDNIKQSICKPNPNVAKVASGVSTAAVASWLLQEFGMLQPVAFVVSTTILLVITNAARDAFCSIGKDDCLARLTKPSTATRTAIEPGNG